MEKNAILAIVLSLLILLAWQYIFIAPQQQKLQEERARQEELARQESSLSEGGISQNSEGQPGLPATVEGFLPSTATSAHRALDERAENIVVETPLLHVEVSTQGARITSWQILEHRDSNGQPVELVSEDARRRGQYPLEISVGDAALDEELNTGLYTSVVDGLTVQAGGETAKLALSYVTASGVTFTKELLFHPDLYRVDVRFVFSETESAGKALSVVWGPGLGADLETTARFVPGIVTKTSSEKKPIRDAAKKIDGLLTHQQAQWTALDRKYFTVALLAENTANTVSLQKLPFQLQDPKEKVEPIRQLLIGLTQPLSEGACEVGLYGGPKERSQLASAYPGFEYLIDYGFFSFIAEPLARFMNFLYFYVKNYGVVIIVLTILIKILFYPLTHKSFHSMKRMQDLQPKMTALREKYKKDNQKLNQEMMKLYKEEGVSPMGGCLPMVLQIPVFFALYQTLSQSIELRGASFLWITDLSAPETIFFRPLVLLMGVTMFFQQSMTPTAADNKQAQMFKFMPILFTAMFWSFPSGLVLYWFMNNILTIGQQYIIKKSGDRKAPKKGKTANDNSEQASGTSRKRKKSK